MIFTFVSGVFIGLLLAVGCFALMVMAIMDKKPPTEEQPHRKEHIAGDFDALGSQPQEIIYH